MPCSVPMQSVTVLTILHVHILRIAQVAVRIPVITIKHVRIHHIIHTIVTMIRVMDMTLKNVTTNHIVHQTVHMVDITINIVTIHRMRQKIVHTMVEQIAMTTAKNQVRK